MQHGALAVAGSAFGAAGGAKSTAPQPPALTRGSRIAALAPGKFQLEVLEADDCAKMGMGCFLGVSEASLEPPKLIHLTYKSGGSATPVAIVGKGLTFDSGGYNLKAGPGSMIELMKFDM